MTGSLTDSLPDVQPSTLLSGRFRGYLPIIIDIETAGFNASTDALLEIAAVIPKMDNSGWLFPAESIHFHIQPFAGANIEPSAIAFNHIDPFNPLRGAVSEKEALQGVFKQVRQAVKLEGCQRAVVTAHNAIFDLSFLTKATERIGGNRTPFHPFTIFDTASLSGLVLGQTVLAKACDAAGVGFDGQQAHSALYDAQKTAELFCELVNRWKKLGGWPLVTEEK